MRLKYYVNMYKCIKDLYKECKKKNYKKGVVLKYLIFSMKIFIYNIYL